MARVPEIRRSRQISNVAAAPKGGGGLGFAALSQIAQTATDFIKPAAIEQAKTEGAAAVYRDADGNLQIDDRNVLGGEMAAAHNATAYAKYLAGRSMDIQANLTELQQQHEYNPSAFKEAGDAYIELLGAEENVPELLREELVQKATSEVNRRFNGLFVNNTNRIQSEAARETSAHRDLLADDYVNLVLAGDMEGAAEVYQEIASVTEYRRATPFISETDSEGEAYLRGLRGTARVAEITKELDGLDQLNSISDERREEIQSLLDDPDINPADRQRLYAATEGKLKGIDGRAVAAALSDSTVEGAVRAYGFGATDREAYYAATKNSESGGNPVARNPNSTAEGHFQFLEGTWNDIMRRHPELNLTPDGRRDPAQSRRAMEAFTEDNAQALARAGLSGSNGNLYAAHFLGAGDAVRVLRSGEGERLTDILSSAVIEANPFLRKMSVSDFREWSARKGGQTAPDIDFAANREALEGFNIAVTPGTEFMAAISSPYDAALLYEVDPDQPVAELLPEVVEQHPVLRGMTAEQAIVWAERRGTVKASDIAARRAAVDSIQDQEVRSIALQSLNRTYQERKRQEDLRAAEIGARVEANDPTLTKQEIMADQGISDSDQRTLSAALDRQRADQIKLQETLADMADPTVRFDPYSTDDRNRSDDVFRQSLGDADPMSAEGQTSAAQIAARTGILPRTMFNALRTEVNSKDPERIGPAMEFIGQVLREQPGAIAAYQGRNEVLDALADYRHHGGFMGPTEAAQRVAEGMAADPPKNVTDAARDLAKDLSPDDIVDHMGELGLDVEMGTEGQQAAVMSEYQRLFKDAFTQTGDAGTAKARALQSLSRVYGPDQVTGSNRLMRFPPQNFYPAVNGSTEWMQQQLVEEISMEVFGAAPEGTGTGNIRYDLLFGSGPSNTIPAENITLNSDERTRQDVAAGRPPSYGVTYIDADGLLHSVQGRFQFDPPTPEAADSQAYNRKRNVLMWQRFYRDQGLPENEVNSTINADIERYASSPPGP